MSGVQPNKLHAVTRQPAKDCRNIHSRRSARGYAAVALTPEVRNGSSPVLRLSPLHVRSGAASGIPRGAADVAVVPPSDIRRKPPGPEPAAVFRVGAGVRELDATPPSAKSCTGTSGWAWRWCRGCAPVSACGPTCCFRRPESAEASRREASRGLTEVFAGSGGPRPVRGALRARGGRVSPGPKSATSQTNAR